MHKKKSQHRKSHGVSGQQATQLFLYLFLWLMHTNNIHTESKAAVESLVGKKITLLRVIPTMTCQTYTLSILTIYLKYILAFYLAFYLRLILTFYLAVYLTFYLAFHLTFYPAFCLAYILAFYVAYQLAFYLAFNLV